jgi:CrcB protein
MARFLWICLGGAIGSGARYLLSGWLARIAGPGFPYNTLAVNAIGSFLLGALMGSAMLTETLPPMLRLTLTTGVIGGFTTYSTFNYETLRLFQEGSWLLGFADLGLTVVVCLLAGALGLMVGRLAS